jgi:hypothetical protein
MNQHHQQPWHDIVIERALEWEDGPEGGAVLLVPRFRRGPLAKWLQPKLRNKHIRVKLDEIGSFVWRRFDGKTRFADIASAMHSHFGAKADPASDRLQKFCATLHKDKFVKLFAQKISS